MKNKFDIIVSKRDNIRKINSYSMRVVAILFSLCLVGIILFIIGYNPIEVYSTILSGALSSKSAIKETIKIIFPILMTSLAASVAFRMKFWNIGAEGQFIIGAIFCSYLAYFHYDINKYLLMFYMLFFGAVGGGLYSIIPAILKIKYKTNETLLTLMFNYIALYFVQYLREGPWKDPESLGFPIMPRFPKNARLPLIMGVHFGWILAILLVILIYIYISKTKHGYELRVVGENINTAKYAGMPINKVIIRTVFLSGAIAGIAGALQVAGADKQLTETIAGGVGFTGVIIAWLSNLSAPIIFIVSILLGVLNKGSSTIEVILKIPSSMASVIQGILLFSILISEFFINYSVRFKIGVKSNG